MVCWTKNPKNHHQRSQERMETKNATSSNKAYNFRTLETYYNHFKIILHFSRFHVWFVCGYSSFFVISRVSRYYSPTKAQPNLGEDSASLAKRGAELEVHSLNFTVDTPFFNESTRPNIPELGCTEANGTTHLTKNSNCDPLRCHTLGQQVFIVGQLLSIAWQSNDPTIDYKQIQPDPKGRSR